MVKYLYIFLKVGGCMEEVNKEMFNKINYNLDFDFTCEYCNNVISTKYKVCPHCGGHYENNREFIEKRNLKNKEYLDFLTNQEIELKKEIESIKKNENVANLDLIHKKNYFNMDVDYLHSKFQRSDDFEFNCEYCGTKIKGTSKDEKSCPNCGSPYCNNTELLILEKKEEIEYDNYAVYNLLQKKKEDINQQRNLDSYRSSQKFIKNLNSLAKFFKYIIIFLSLIVIVYFFIRNL